MKVLETLEIEYVDEYTFNNCRNSIPLRFDFYIPSLNALIEYDGRQHFMPVNFGGISDERAAENFETQKINDKIKDDYCTANSIPLLRIPYMRFDETPQLISEFINGLSA